MSNVVGFATRKKEKVQEAKGNDAQNFLSEFYDWARENGIDTETTRFKYDAATVLTVVQSLLHERD